MTRFHVIIPAAGSSSRMGADSPKQYLSLNGEPLIQHVIKVFDQAAKISSINVILSPDDTHWPSTDIASSKLQVHYCGGETRATTVLNGLNAISSQVEADDWVLVHDAARPGLSNQLLNQLLITLEEDSVGGLLALPLADTLKRADDEQRVSTTVPRTDLWQAQTPQMFRYATLKQALTAFEGTPTDEAEAIEALGLKPKLVTGELRNLKVTYPQDLAVLSALLD
ncbi:MAG TPA: 2-C-methyl-D-erythritol 4-phosphate cytidylyltransferase [Methylotenera sp.]|nr:2-C-methyl-D-erythritol 4-phosphate cytidylyltransferase [Methylotenera sp.]